RRHGRDQGDRSAPPHCPAHERGKAQHPALRLRGGTRRHRARVAPPPPEQRSGPGCAGADLSAVPGAGAGARAAGFPTVQCALRRRAGRDRASPVGAPGCRHPDSRWPQGAGGTRRAGARAVGSGGRDAPGERGGAQQQGEARRADRLDHHHHQSRQAGRHRQHADHQRPGSGHHRRQPRPRPPGGRGRRHRDPAHHESPLVLPPPLRGRLRRGRHDPGAQGVPGASRHDFHRRLSFARLADMRAARGIGSLLLLVTACGGGGSSSLIPPPGDPPPFPSVTQVRVSQASTFTAGCDGVPATGTLYTNTAAEPYLAVNPTSPLNLISAWQQNRWSDGGAQGLNLAASFDGGMTWTLSNAAFSLCTGGNSGNAGNYARATDVWLTVSPTGVVYALALSFSGGTLLPGSSSGMLVAQSRDGGLSWSAPIALIQDGATVFNDKGSITADPTDANYVYAVWDRLSGQTAGPSYFAVTADAGATWQAARIYDPGPQNQTLGNQIVVLPGDVVVNIFTELGATSALVRAMQSTDHGTKWSAPVTVSDLQAVGTTDPNTHAVV